MDFSDQIELGARLAVEQPEVGALERERFRVVLLDEYQDTSVAQATMLSRLFSGRAPGWHAVTAVGDPNQAIYGWRGASVSNILHFADTFPAADGGAVPTLPAHRQPPLRPAHPRGRQPAGRAALRQVRRPGRAGSAAKPRRRRRRRRDRGSSRPRPTSWPGWPTRSTRPTTPARRGPTSACSPATTPTPPRSSTPSPRADIPVEIVGLSGLIRLPEVAEVVATLHLLNDVTANAALLTLLTGPRWAIGPRDLRLLGRRAAALAGGTGRARPTTLGDQLIGIADGIDPAEIAALGDALDSTRATRRTHAEALERFALLVGRAPDAARAPSASRCSTSSAGSSTPRASTSSWPRRSRPAAAARRDNLDLFVKAVAEFQAVDGDVHAAGAAGLPHRRGRPGQRPRPRHPDRRRLGQAAHRPPRQGPGVGLACSWSGVCETRFPSNRSRTLWTSSPAVLPAPLRGDARDLPQLAGLRQGGARRLPRRHPRARRRRRSSGSATSRSPGPPTASA